MQEGVLQTFRFKDGMQLAPEEGRHQEIMDALKAIEVHLEKIAAALGEPR